MLASTKRTNAGLDLTSLLLRLTFGFAMAYGHGWGKLMRFFGDGPVRFRDPLGVGVELSLGLATFAELLCSGLLIIGLFTRWATIPLIITMGVIIFMVHFNDPFNKLESPLMYLTAYVAILLMGPGKYSLDKIIRK
jgi:putative oxidoreductase